MLDAKIKEPRILVVGYSSSLKGGVTQVTKVLAQNFVNMDLHPCLYCYSPKFKAVTLYLYSVLKFAGKLIFPIKGTPDFVLLIIGSTGDVVRVLPFIWMACLFKVKLAAQYHKSGDVIFAGIGQILLKKFVMFSLRKIRIHSFLSKRLKENFEKIVPYPVESIVIPNALEKKWIDILPLSIDERKRDVVFFGRWSTEKGVDDLVQCMGQISGLLNCEIYTNHIPTLKIHNCTVYPWVSEEKVMEIMRTAKLLVLPSYAEAYPTVLLEAAACGTPFVASNIAGIPDIVEESKGGQLFEKGNVLMLQEKIEEILNDKEAWLTMSKCGKAWVEILSEKNIKKQWIVVADLLAKS